MLPSIPRLSDYDVSPFTGFLPEEMPLEILPDPYYNSWEKIVRNLQGLILSGRLREVVDRMPVLSTIRLRSQAEWRRAYMVLSFMSHAYIWGGDVPAEVVPPSISLPFMSVCIHFDLPTVATYAGVCLWNFKPLFDDEPIDNLENLSTLTTFTGSIDESWFYLVSVAIEARGASTIPIMLEAIAAARVGDTATVTLCLQSFAERLADLSRLLLRMYDHCDPHVFYHRIRPFLAGSKNMAEAGLPQGVCFDNGSGRPYFVQRSGGSNAQSSLIQFFDIVLGITHSAAGDSSAGDAPSENFIQEMRSYMPGPHRMFLKRIADIANIRDFVALRSSNVPLTTAYDACLAMLRDFRDKHVQIVTRYIVLQSRTSRTDSRSISPRKAPGNAPPKHGLANAKSRSDGTAQGNRRLKGTGGTALIPFLKQARDETGEPAIGSWARRLLASTQLTGGSSAPLGGVEEHANGVVEIVGLAGTWSIDDSEGGICHW